MAQRREGDTVPIRVGSLALSVLLACLLGCSGSTVTTVIDERAFGERLRLTTDLDSQQSACVARQVFLNFDAESVQSLYEQGASAIAGSVAAQRYAELLIGCAAK